MKRLFSLALLLVAASATASGQERDTTVVRVFGEEINGAWARCPFVILLAQRRANRELGLTLDGKVVLTGSGAPAVEYAVALPRGRLRLRVRASMKSHEFSGWHPPDTDSENRHELQLDGPGLTAAIESRELGTPVVAIFKAAAEECMGAKPSR